MTLHNFELSDFTTSDIDSHGALRLPVGTRSIKNSLTYYIRDCGINEISYHVGTRIQRAPIVFIDDKMYIVTRDVRFGNTSLQQLSTPLFCENGICGDHYYSIEHDGASYFDESMDSLIKTAREDIWSRKLTDTAKKLRMPQYATDIILSALSNTISSIKNARISAVTRQQIDSVISHLNSYFIGINTFCARYRNNDALDELSYVNLNELGQIILPIVSQNLGKTCTRIVKRRADNANHVHAMMLAGYKNPGCFPYQWLEHVQKNQRGAVTDELHSAFRRATSDLYTPKYFSQEHLQYNLQYILDNLARRIMQLTQVPTNIEYCSHGFFSKTYKITCENQAYILKIYHSDVQYYTAKNYAHDIEAQNSFLVSNKKYCGRIRYRTVLTAGISNQRGGRYILYPFVDGEQCDVKYNPYDIFKTYQFCDNIGNGNQCGNTIIDTGMIHVNQCRIGRPYMTKIINTVLYRPWDDLAIVLGKYNARQISESVEYISQRIQPDTPHRDRIIAKIEFLKRRVR